MSGHVAYTGEMRNICTVLIGKTEGNRPLGDLDVARRIILKWILEK
jgi:hypothetical protein